MRALKTSDVFAFARVIKASGMREELSALTKKIAATENFDVESVGYESILVIIEALAERKSEKVLYEALAPVLEVAPNDIGDLAPSDFLEALKQIAEQNDLRSFFKSLSAILGKN